MGYLLDRLGLHISVANGCPWRGGADVGFPVGVDREESTGCGGHHSSAIQARKMCGRPSRWSVLGRSCVLWDCGWCCLVLGRMAVGELVGSVQGCVVRCEVAMGWVCGCGGCNGEGCGSILWV